MPSNALTSASNGSARRSAPLDIILCEMPSTSCPTPITRPGRRAIRSMPSAAIGKGSGRVHLPMKVKGKRLPVRLALVDRYNYHH